MGSHGLGDEERTGFGRTPPLSRASGGADIVKRLGETASTLTTAALLTAEDAAGLVPDWAKLAARALEPNVFLDPWMALARLRHLPDRAGARILVARRGAERNLVGLSLLVRPRGTKLNPLPVLRTAELYAPLSTPLLDPEQPAETFSAMLAVLERAGTAGLVLPFAPADGPVAAAVRAAAALRGNPIAVLGRHRRAFLRSTLAGEDYLRTTLERRRRREAERQRRRLAELGRLETILARGEREVADAVERFLVLEASGWNGRAGTDLAAASGGAGYIREAALAGAREDAIRIASLTLDGRPIASGIVAVAGRRAFYVKTAYDEDFARHSPGLLLTLDLTAHLLDDAAIDDADSIAIADHPMIDRIWQERLAIESLMIGPRGQGPLFRTALAIEHTREWGREAAKNALARRRSGG